MPASVRVYARSVLGAVAFAWISAAAQAAFVDQSNFGTVAAGYADVNKGTGEEIGQSFTAGASGLLAQVNLPIYDEGIYSPSFSYYGSPLSVSVLDSNLNVLGTTTISNVTQSTNPPNSFDVSPSFLNLGVTLSAGQSYYIATMPTAVVPSTTAGNGLSWLATNANYAGGNPVLISGSTATPFFANQYDLEFQTLVTPVTAETLQGGADPAHPVSISQKVTVNTGTAVTSVSYFFGPGFGTYDYYDVEDLCPTCHEVSTISVTGANPDESFTYELFNTQQGFLESVVLDAADNFTGSLAFSPSVTDYEIGVYDNSPNDFVDPTFTISFSSPVGGADFHSVPEPRSLLLLAGGLVMLGLSKRRASPRKSGRSGLACKSWA